ncbi:hypothetical protein ACWKSP_01025 [Micromonosporaceae bacterium Da 78-11]
MILAVIFGLAVLGGATWMGQDHPMRHRRLTVGLLSLAVVVLVAAVAWAVVTRP